MNPRFVFAALWLLLFLPGCSPATPAPAPGLIAVYASPAAQPWLQEAFTCMQGQDTALNVVNDPRAAELQLRLGEPAALSSPAYQIDSEEILIAAHRESPAQNLTLDQVRQLFAGRGDPALQVWVYSQGDDIQRAFDSLVMQGGAVTSLARLAVSPQQMSDVLNADKDAVGILPRHWKAGSARELFSAGNVPVLAITSAEPTGALASLIACLQK